MKSISPGRTWAPESGEERPKRTKERLGFGGYEPPGGGSRTDARIRFLDAVKKHVPAVLDDLAGEPFQLYQQLAQQLAQDDDTPMSVYVLIITDVHPTSDWGPMFDPLHRRLRAWSRHWHLDADWCRHVALKTLYEWHEPPDKGLLALLQAGPLPPEPMGQPRGWAQAAIPLVSPIRDEEMRFTFAHRGWQPMHYTRDVAEQAIRAAFDAHLTRYLDRLECLAKERGLKPTPEKRALTHFDWLALYQVKGWRPAKIADWYHEINEKGAEVSAIRMALQETARLIGLPLRPSRRGRPPTTGAKHSQRGA